MVDALSNRFPIPATVAASEETGTRSSAIHLSRAAQVDRYTFGRSSAQVFVNGPRGGASSDQEGRSCNDYDADHNPLDVVKTSAHHLSQSEIGGDKRIRSMVGRAR